MISYDWDVHRDVFFKGWSSLHFTLLHFIFKYLHIFCPIIGHILVVRLA